MTQRRRFSAEYKREAVVMLDALGVSVSQVAADLGIGATVLGRWRRELRQGPDQAFVGHGRPRDGELALRSGIFCETRPRSSRARRDAVSDDPTMPRGLSPPDDVPMCAGLPQRVLRLGQATAESASPGECPITHADSSPPC